MRYTTIQNWADNVYNLVTKRAVAYKEATMEWVDGNLGSKLTMNTPPSTCSARGRTRKSCPSPSLAPASIRTPAARSCMAPAHIVHHYIQIDQQGRRTQFLPRPGESGDGAKGARSKVVCDALILDKDSRSDTYPVMEIDESDVSIAHEASVSRIQEEQLFYLMSRGLSETAASTMIVNGFIEPLVKELPMEYAVEMNRLIELQMEGSVG